MTDPILLPESGRNSSTPVIKASRIGEIASIALVRFETRDRKESDGATMINQRTGKPAQELVIHGLSMPGMTAAIGLGDHSEVPQPGTPCRFILKGLAFSHWIDAKKKIRNGRLAVGDVVSREITFAQAYDQARTKSGPELRTQAEADAVPRGRTLGYYGPLTIAEGTDAAMIEAASEAYRAYEASKRIPLDDDGGDDEWG